MGTGVTVCAGVELALGKDKHKYYKQTYIVCAGVELALGKDKQIL